MKRKSIRKVVEDPKEDEYYILVSRYNIARYYGSFDELEIENWDRELAPSEETLNLYKEAKIDWQEYKERFLENKPEEFLKQKAAKYKEEAGEKEVVLVCQEEQEDYPKCHTWIILEALR